MFISHFATGLGFYLQKKGSKLAFFLLVLGTQIADILWGLFTLLDIEGGFTNGSVEYNSFDFPWSHSLVMMIVWSILYGFATQWYVLQKNPELTGFGLISGISVFSHWVLDFIVHGDDMLVFPTGPDTTVPSLHLWDYPLVSFFLELLIVGVLFYYYWSNHDEEGFKASKKPFAMLGFMVFVHVSTYLPTFDDTPAEDVASEVGALVLIMILLITAVMTWLHPLSEDS
ncbi:MAG: hypothetical protein ACW99A_21830 [Candidatus Kariarchaeaceae archaeon]|jgi:uncharacterized membrane protein (DUF485 family)